MIKFDKQHEVSKLEAMFKIPISNLRFETETVTIFSGKSKVGSVPYYDALVIKYDDSDIVRQGISWFDIYANNKTTLDREAKQLFPNSKTELTIGPFRTMYIRLDNEARPHAIDCRYENEKWHVELK
jgi:hypothetical protein